MALSATLGDAVWTEIAAAPPMIAVPLGACEQHGPHLPLATDTIVATALAERLAARRANVSVAPALPYGASGEHAGFAGTLSLGTDALRMVLVELVRSADAFAGVVLISAHGGNSAAVAGAIDVLGHERRAVLAWSPSASVATAAAGRDADAHAGHVETSVLLALAPQLVHLEDAAPGTTAPLPSLLAQLRSVGVAGVSANGVLGDPTGASASDGRRILDGWSQDLIDAVDRWRPASVGRR
jgi:creatinine amidohydrolase